MNEMSTLPEIEKAKLDYDAIGKFETEEDFISVSVSLLIETGSYICVAGSISPANTKAWDSDQAIVGGTLLGFTN